MKNFIIYTNALKLILNALNALNALINNSFANDNSMTSIKEMSFINCMRMKILDLIKSVDKII